MCGKWKLIEIRCGEALFEQGLSIICLLLLAWCSSLLCGIGRSWVGERIQNDICCV